MKQHLVTAGEIEFACLRSGSGERLALCLHGFPDDAGSMAPMIDALASAGFTAVAPWMRGYGATGSPRDGSYDIAALAGDAIALTRALGFDTAFLVGHDWGAVASYAAANLAPELFPRIVAIAVPPLPLFLRGLRMPAQLTRSWYMARFQLPGAVDLLRRDDFELIDRLWRDWSPTWRAPAGRLAEVKQTFATGRTAEAAVAYYRHLLPRFGRWRAYRRALSIALRRPRVPTLVVAGDGDGCIGPELYRGLESELACCRLEMIADVGHFAHLESPDAVEKLVREFLLEAV